MKPGDVIHEPPKNEATSCLHPFSRLPAIPITFWFNACSIVKLFSFSSAIMERFSGLGADFVYNLFPTLCTAPGMNLRSGTGRDTNPPIDPRKAVWAQRSAASLPKFSAADFFVRFMYLFPAVLGLHCRVGAFLCGEREPLSGCAAWVSHCGGFSCGAPVWGLSSCSFWPLAHRLSSCGACGALGLVPHASWHVESSQIRDKTQSPALAGGFLTTGGGGLVPKSCLILVTP